MKKVLMLVLVVSITLVSSYAIASVIGTPHDLAPEPCAMCHTPHNASANYPLWNREQTTTGSYTMYSAVNSPSFDMGPTASQPGNPSNLCLVCHNGQFSSLVNYPGPCNVNPDPAYDLEVAGCANLELDLTNDHPISFTYNPQADVDSGDNNGFPNITNVTGSQRRVITGAVSSTYYFLYGTNRDQFECATCHSVHDVATYDGKGSTTVYFLRHDNAGSTLCRDCHYNR
jgi:hypothetical protein